MTGAEPKPCPCDVGEAMVDVRGPFETILEAIVCGELQPALGGTNGLLNSVRRPLV